VGQGGEDTPILLKQTSILGELPKFQFVLGDGPIKKWLITIKIIYIILFKKQLEKHPNLMN
jgi:hypothetical protein